MKKIARSIAPALLAFAATSVAPWAALSAAAGDGGSVQNRCAAKTNHSYGFQCHGWASVGPGSPLEPVTFLGTVAGSRTGEFNGTGTFNSSLGAARQRVSGLAAFHDRSCSGFIQYKVWLVLPGTEIPLPDLPINFVTVNGGTDVLGAPTAAAGKTGNEVPRMVCRLMRSDGR